MASIDSRKIRRKKKVKASSSTKVACEAETDQNKIETLVTTPEEKGVILTIGESSPVIDKAEDKRLKRSTPVDVQVIQSFHLRVDQINRILLATTTITILALNRS